MDNMKNIQTMDITATRHLYSAYRRFENASDVIFGFSTAALAAGEMPLTATKKLTPCLIITPYIDLLRRRHACFSRARNMMQGDIILRRKRIRLMSSIFTIQQIVATYATSTHLRDDTRPL